MRRRSVKSHALTVSRSGDAYTQERVTPASAPCRLTANAAAACSIHSRRILTGAARTFFQPIPFDLQPPDLAIERVRISWTVRLSWPALGREQALCPIMDLALPLADLDRMHPMLLPDLVDRLDPTDRLQADLRFEGRRRRLAPSFTHFPTAPLG